MNYIATITSKRQFTILVELYQALSLREGEKVLVTREKNTINISPVMQLVNQLAGSVKVPKAYKGLSTEAMIKKAKREYFRNKK